MLLLLATVLSCNGVAQAWVNAYDGKLFFTCPHEYQAINKVISHHDNKHEDRVWDFTCADITASASGLKTACSWSGLQNNYDAPFSYTCPTNTYLSGMQSTHDNHYEDRRWNFYCCSSRDFHLLDCSRSGATNDYDRDQSYHVSPGKVIKGLDSKHDNHHEDRIWDYEVCKIIRLGDGVVG